jgi:hypothetical protein
MLWTFPGSWDVRLPVMAFCGHIALPPRMDAFTALRLPKNPLEYSLHWCGS